MRNNIARTINPFPFPPMQHIKDLLTAAAITFILWVMAVAFLSL
jgi:hypothetical protein